MHYHLEIIMPPADDIESAVNTILAPFREEGTDEDGKPNRHVFWDWFVIGGRWAGAKLQAQLDPAKLQAFNDKLTEMQVTVSSLQAGKQELKPESQIPVVDALWAEYFPEQKGKPCPLFAHSNNQYDGKDLLPDDVMRFADVPPSLPMSRVIFAGWDYEEKKLEAKFMLADSIWNGCNHEDTAWKQTLKDAVELFKAKHKDYTTEYVKKITPQDNWLVVTVDYHS